MKKVYILIPVAFLIGILLVLILPKDKSSLAVRENIVQTETSYSWEQWCWYGSKKVHVANFELKGKMTDAGDLNTDICN